MDPELLVRLKSLSPSASFIVSQGREQSVLYVHQGFADLYGLCPAACQGRSCKSILNDIQVSAERLTRMAQFVAVERAVIERKLQFLDCYAAHEHRSIIKTGPCGEVGVVLMLHITAGGDVFTCEFTTFALPHPALELCTVSVQTDVTSTFSVDHILNVASTGEYFKLIRSHRAKVNIMEPILHLRREVAPLMLTSTGWPQIARANLSNTSGSLDPSHEGEAGTASQQGEVARLRRVACGTSGLLAGAGTKEQAAALTAVAEPPEGPGSVMMVVKAVMS